jgi:hypothetical protein
MRVARRGRDVAGEHGDRAECDRQPDDDAAGRHAGAFADDQRQYVARTCAERHTNADLARALRDAVGDHAV